MFFSYDSKHAKLLKAIANDPDTPFTLREVFEDPALGQAVADAVGLDGLKTKTNLIRLGLLEKLDAPGRGIESLEGLEFLNGLREADLSGNKIRRLPIIRETYRICIKTRTRSLIWIWQGIRFSRRNHCFRWTPPKGENIF